MKPLVNTLFCATSSACMGGVLSGKVGTRICRQSWVTFGLLFGLLGLWTPSLYLKIGLHIDSVLPNAVFFISFKTLVLVFITTHPNLHGLERNLLKTNPLHLGCKFACCLVYFWLVVGTFGWFSSSPTEFVYPRELQSILCNI